jgi:hypothetical protein
VGRAIQAAESPTVHMGGRFVIQEPINTRPDIHGSFGEQINLVPGPLKTIREGHVVILTCFNPVKIFRCNISAGFGGVDSHAPSPS